MTLDLEKTAGAVAQRCEQLQERIAELEAELEAATYDPKAKERLQSFRFAMSQNNKRITELEAEVERLNKYVRHDEDCPASARSWRRMEAGPCNCGLESTG